MALIWSLTHISREAPGEPTAKPAFMGTNIETHSESTEQY